MTTRAVKRTLLFAGLFALLHVPAATLFAQTNESAPDTATASAAEERINRLKNSRTRIAPRIVGGQQAQPTRWPWAVAITFPRADGSLFQYCGGTLIAPRWVLTAAHCDVRLGDSVIVGRHDLTTNAGEVIDVQRVVYTADSGLPAYNPNLSDHDIALVELANDATVEPVPFIGANAANTSAGEPMTVIGWGLLEEGGNASDTLQQVTVPLFSQGSCAALYGQAGIPITGNMICAGLNGKDSCQGDSGGGAFVTDPLQNRDRVAGVVSFGIGCARPNFPGVYTKVDNYVTWIVSVTGVAVNRVSGPLGP